MPMYSYRCDCGKKFTRLLKLADYQSPQFHECGHTLPALKLIEAPAVRGDYPGYECPVSGKWVEGRKAHQENLKRTGCRLFEPGETSAYQAQVRKDDEALEASIEATADQLITSLPVEKRDRLAAEMEHGLDVEIVRN